MPRLRREWLRFLVTARRLDGQTVFVLVAAVVFALVQFTLGDRRFFREELAYLFDAEWRGVLAWAWWFGVQGVTGFVLPVLCLRLLFKRSAAAMGLGAG